MIDNLQAKELMQRAKHGDKEAFALLYENFYTPIFRYIYSKIAQKDQAEDMTQTVFMKAFGSRENFTEDTYAPIAYFFTIARNLIIDSYRKKSEVLLTPTEDNRDIFAEIPDKELTPHDRVLEGEQSQLIGHLIDKLKPDYKKIIHLKFIAQLSNREIAKKTGKTEQNVRQIQVRALRKLKELLT